LVPSNAASIKVHERIRLEKFCFFCFSRSKSFFFFCLSLSGEIVSLSLSSSRNIQQSDEKSPTNVVIFCVGSISAFSCVCFCAFRQKEKENIILKNFCSLFLSLLLLKKYRSSESAAAARTR
jgi:cell division protein FtsW (lipid II flippase)